MEYRKRGRGSRIYVYRDPVQVFEVGWFFVAWVDRLAGIAALRNIISGLHGMADRHGPLAGVFYSACPHITIIVTADLPL